MKKVRIFFFVCLIINISNAQNVGIGTLTPIEKLEVSGGKLLISNNDYGLEHNNGNVSIGTKIRFNAGWVGTLSNNPLRFFTNDSLYASLTISNKGNIGIGTQLPSGSALLEIKSSTQGFLPPRMTIDQRDAITNPATGLLIFCIDCDELEVFNGIVWKNMSSTAACVLSTLPYIKICDQIWMSKNLDVSTYRNGDIIPQVTNPAIWASLTIGAWCWYNNDSATYAATYGKLYNWYAVNDPRGLAPQGWHVPSQNEWFILGNCLGSDHNSGGRMKEVGTVHWASPNTGADNSSGFAALPGGNCYSNGIFNDLGNEGHFWCSTEISSTNSAWNFNLL